MKISILTPDFSSNCLGRAFMLAKTLQRHFDVEIIGPIFGKEIWLPLANENTIKYKFVKISRRLKVYNDFKKLLGQIKGDIVYASKPLISSFGLALIKKYLYKKPLVLDIDDWDYGGRREFKNSLGTSKKIKFLLRSIISPYTPLSYWNNKIFDYLTHLANEITVSNYFLQRRYGGKIIWHARDTEYFDPVKFDKNKLRKKYGISIKSKNVIFFGTPRIHKGVDDLIKAMSLIKNDNINLIIVGLSSSIYSNYIKNLGENLLGKRFRSFGLQPFEKVPEFLSIADLVVIPQKRSNKTVGQIPAKIFDGMAMAKPIIGTNVSDLPKILHNCGWIIEPENPEILSEMILYVLDNPQEANQNGINAREKCIKKYSWDAIDKKLFNIFQKYEKN